MAFLHIQGVSLKGVSACVPKNILENRAYPGFNTDEAEKFISSTGVVRHRIAGPNICTSDLCYHSAEKLISELSWGKDDIDCLIFVTQTPDYLIPATACLLQERLGLKEDVIAFDVSLGCSGWIYGLQILSSLLSHGQIKKGLLLTGDTILKVCSVEDKSTFPLFGDAGTATALEYSEISEGFRFHLSSEGGGYETIIIPEGGFRSTAQLSSFEVDIIEPGISKNRLQLVLDGMNVFSFGISRAPESVIFLTERYGIDIEKVNFFVFHQANLFMIEKIRKKLKLPIEKVPYSLKNFGNTSSASIPLTLVSQTRGQLEESSNKILACGFGVGLSWGSVYFETNSIICPEIIEI